jgi:tetratricopeptide (TPR) repeat protein
VVVYTGGGAAARHRHNGPVMEEARRELARMRESATAWQELEYKHATGSDDLAYDVNEVHRAMVLWALQYDRRPEDLPLLRFLVEQEALCRRHAPFQGLGEQAELAGFLLAEHRQVEDVWRQYAIKRANFDTWCGYDREYVFVAGVRATLDVVRASDHPERDELLEYFGETDLDDDDLREWAERKRSWFPDEIADEDPLTWVERATLAGETELARSELDRWARDRPRDAGTLNRLRYELASLGAFAEAAQAQRDALRFAETGWDRASGWQTLAELERKAGEHGKAWEALQETRKALDGVEGWQEVGLGRNYVEQLFLLAGVAEIGLAREVCAEAERQARDVPRLPPVVEQAAAEARERLR